MVYPNGIRLDDRAPGASVPRVLYAGVSVFGEAAANAAHALVADHDAQTVMRAAMKAARTTREFGDSHVHPAGERQP